MNFKTLAALCIFSSSILSAPAAMAQDSGDRNWDLTLGLTTASVPEFHGSSDQDYIVLPLIDFDYEFHPKSHLFVNTFKGAGYEYDGERIIWGAKLGWRRGRDEGDSRRFEGMGDVDDTVTAGGYVGLKFGQLQLMADYQAGLDNNNDGIEADFSAKYFMRSVDGKLGGFVGAKSTYGDDAFHENYFQVPPDQVRADRPEYEADAGMVGYSAMGGVNYLLKDHHFFGANASYTILTSDVKDSPIAEDDNHYMLGISYGYKF